MNTDQTGRIQDRAEELQARSAGMIRVARGTEPVLPIVILLIAWLSWLLFR